LGLPWRQATEEQRQKSIEASAAMMRKWKAAGIELVGYFGAPSAGATGHVHNYIFRVKDAAQFHQMAADVDQANEAWKIVERHAMTFGWDHGRLEWWAKL